MHVDDEFAFPEDSVFSKSFTELLISPRFLPRFFGAKVDTNGYKLDTKRIQKWLRRGVVPVPWIQSGYRKKLLFIK